MVTKRTERRTGILLSGVLLVITAILAVDSPTYAFKWVKFVIDKNAIAAVAENTATVSAIEYYHNAQLDTIKKRQNTMAEYSAAMASIKELYKYSLENIKGFGTESEYYIQIGEYAANIGKNFPVLISSLGKAKIPGKAMWTLEAGNLVTRTYSLVNDFINIVNNGKVKNPLPSKQVRKENDGYNFLNRNDRLSMAIRILGDLRNINFQIEYMIMLANYASWGQLFYTLDPDTYCTLLATQSITKTLVGQWSALKY